MTISLFEIVTLLIVLAALFSYVNARYFRLPTTIGVMFISLSASLILILSGAQHVKSLAINVLAGIDFNALVLHGVLAFLLFAGALHLNLSELIEQWLPVTLLSLLGTLISTFFIGYLLWTVLEHLDLHIPLIQALLFGALISPTDPIAILGIMRSVGAPKSLEIQTIGESLFNDAIGIVIFLTLLDLAVDSTGIHFGHVVTMAVRQSLGGAGFGLVTGFGVFQMLKRIDDYHVEVLLTIALAMGTYAGAEALRVSAPIAVIVAGLLVGNPGRHFAMSKKTEQYLDAFWEIIDEILNAILFLLIGLQVLVMPFPSRFVYAGLAGIIITLISRWFTVGGLVFLMKRFRRFERGAVTILTWGGLRGGLSVAMALSLPQSSNRNLLLAITYCVVVFSVFVQGLTMRKVIQTVSQPTA